MDVKRAQEILHASETIPVHHNGESVWIDEIDRSSGMARVHVGKDAAKARNVPVAELNEVH